MTSPFHPLTILRFSISISVLFFQSALIVAAQFLGFVAWPFSRKLFRSYIRHTMELWTLHLVALNQYFAPSKLVLTVDESITRETVRLEDGIIVERDEGIETILKRDGKGRILGLKNMPWRVVLMANHQARCLPCQCPRIRQNHSKRRSQVDADIRMRKWSADRPIIESNLQRSATKSQPLWLIVFPEGTVISESNRKKSKSFAEKNDLTDLTYSLLPRSTGLNLCTTTLTPSVDYVYDLTIGYDGIKPGEIPEKVYTLRRIYFQGMYPKRVHVHLRRFPLASLPTEDAAYATWLRDRWAEKDTLLAHFYAHGAFPGEERAAPARAKVRSEWTPEGDEVVIVEREEGEAVHVSATMEPKLNSLLDLTQVWFCLLPYLPIVQFIRQYWHAVAAIEAATAAAEAA
ncbi:hypothetical protein BC936DRAFT_143117 [Jimgerdemannia flammicorona]|uniref:Acyltransferase C-terminal domain-containing protein n=1 Tax=Jimgerdemannia flammicorona TaxID=994334 RepID=A0A432ZZM4_9FUNG|nr:hypothetical protein BC936DRAFT_143117 [Jimgerdemannia flammicorona]